MKLTTSKDMSLQYRNQVMIYYTHIAHSMHIYEKDEAAILRMLGR